MNDNKLYLSTSIPYVNSDPHVGFALELVQGDVLARHARSRGVDVLFQGGTDDNSLKNVKAAEIAGKPVIDLVRENARKFERLAEILDVQFDEFVSTGRDMRHRRAVEGLWLACAASGDLYRRSYEGLYCVGCEQYYTDGELVDGCCPEHGTRPDLLSENNWFFRLSRYTDRLLAIVENGELEIVPEPKRNEVLAFLRSGLSDICVSRSAERAKGWGIPVPGDPGEVVYVWFDALANYITGAGFGNDDDRFSLLWTKAAERTHLVGKGITRFHAIYWPAILLSAGLGPPTKILVHGYLTVDGRKIGKSNGNGIDPFELVKKYGLDAVRWYLLRHIRTTEDADFTEERLVTAHDADLADQLGNLVNRTIAVFVKAGRPLITHQPEKSDFGRLTSALGIDVGAAIDRFSIHEAAAAVSVFVAEANRHIVNSAPWSVAKRLTEPAAAADFDRTVFELVEAFAAVSTALSPILPGASARLADTVGAFRLGTVAPIRLFPKIGGIIAAGYRKPTGA